jgi:hypothetical protein
VVPACSGSKACVTGARPCAVSSTEESATLSPVGPGVCGATSEASSTDTPGILPSTRVRAIPTRTQVDGSAREFTPTTELQTVPRLSTLGRAGRLVGALGFSMPRLLMGYRTLIAERASWEAALAHAASVG